MSANTEAGAANPETINTKDHCVAPGSQRNSNIDNDPKSTNRAQRTAPMPEECGKNLKEAEAEAMSGGKTSGAMKGHTGSGKGPATVE